LSKIIDLCAAATSFRIVVERCALFELEAEAAKDELGPVIDTYLATTKYLRLNLKPDVWNFI
jgi:hypothetical protein